MVNGFMPRSLKEALDIRSKYDVVPYGGGTDLMIQGKNDVKYLFLNKVPEMKLIVEDDEYIRIGGSCTFTEVLESDIVPEIMKQAVSKIAAPAIRNAGTMAGNIGNGSAKADSVLIEYVADAKLVLASSSNTRIVKIDDFYKGRKELDLGKDELIVEILLPKTGLENYYYKKVGARNALAISRVSFAGVIKIDNEKIKDIAIAFGAVSGTVLRFKELEKIMIGKTLHEANKIKKDFIKAYEQKIIPTRGRVSSEYRKKVCLNLLKDFLEEKGI
ncbi:FAD binding domain-containing protein [Clostridium taeniosporum]|uniref:Molybdopterin dehydrogenase n=1 Tax=Clostridium taeniosporum TaxID=394958 RepID=A0A1D7XMS9_9CLOT|nr:FAD binding domain-containing protein [Clostridium taeniosporum]AOR24651.1 molybdopterin dehydrogenase [Clostridium taeniosporum]